MRDICNLFCRRAGYGRCHGPIRSLLGVWLITGFLVPSALAQGPPDELAGLDEYIERGMQDWDIPGLAIAVVKDDELIYAEGFGVKRLGEGDPVDENTLFGVASTTKAMTAAQLGMLVDEGRLDWDDPVTDYLPWFRLSEPWVTRNVTIRDLLTHQVGVGRLTGNRLRFMPSRERNDMLRFIEHHEFEQPFRSEYVYSNVMYTVAGQVVEAVTGQSWDAFMHERLFQPLGMETSNTSIHDFSEGDNTAWPHQEINGEVQPIPRRDFDVVGPSASVNTSVKEMAQWMRLNLGEPGVYEGERLLSEQVMQDKHSAQVSLSRSNPSGAPITGYGLGWRLSDYRGYLTYQHGGAADGMNTSLALVPDKNLGVVVVSNTFNNLRSALVNRVIDRYIGAEQVDWHERYYTSHVQRKEQIQAMRDQIHENRQEGTEPTHELETYTGTYHDNLYDNAVVYSDGGGLVLRLWDDDKTEADLTHWHHDTFRAEWRNPAMREEFVTFTTGPEGAVRKMNIEFVLRPLMLQVGAYPSNYTRTVAFEKQD